MPETKIPTSIRLDPETMGFLKREADRRSWSVSMLLRHVISQWVDYRRKQTGAAADSRPEASK